MRGEMKKKINPKGEYGSKVFLKLYFQAGFLEFFKFIPNNIWKLSVRVIIVISSTYYVNHKTIQNSLDFLATM